MMDEIAENLAVKESGSGFIGQIQVVVTAEVTHPPGTLFDEDGMPISPSQHDVSDDETHDVPSRWDDAWQ